MSETMLPISADALFYRSLLFELNKPVTITPTIFDEVWPYVDSVYSKLRSDVLQAYGKVRVQTYECRLRKSRKSSTRESSDGKVIKRRHSTIRDQGLCNVRIKVSHLVDGSEVIIERLDENIHTHDIEESFRIKKPSILLNCITVEASKNYSAANIFHALRGAGTVEGTERLEASSSLTRHAIGNLKRSIKTADKRLLPRGTTFEDDISQARKLLIEKDWKFAELKVADSKKDE